MGPRGGGGGFGFGFLHVIGSLIGMALFLALLALLAGLVFKVAVKKGWVRKPRHHGHGPHGHRPEPGGPSPQHPHEALRILDERLARSEIEIDDYKARRDALTGNSFPPFHQPPQPPVEPPAMTDEGAPHVPPAP